MKKTEKAWKWQAFLVDNVKPTFIRLRENFRKVGKSLGVGNISRS